MELERLQKELVKMQLWVKAKKLKVSLGPWLALPESHACGPQQQLLSLNSGLTPAANLV
jgi:hypothetical protein